MHKQLITTLCVGLLSTMPIFASKILDRGPHLHFGTVDANGTTSVTRDLNLTNRGTEDLEITEIRFHDNGNGAYTTTGWDSGIIAPGESQLVPIKFDPEEEAGERNYDIAVYIESDKTNDGDRDRILFGKSTSHDVGCTRILEFGKHLVYGETAIGTTKTKILTIKNDGWCDLNVTGITYNDRTDGKFTGNWSGIIPPYSSHNVNITYAPTDIGSNSGLLYIKSNRTNKSERSRALIGTGI